MDWFGWFAGLHTLLVTALAINVSRLRITLRVANGDGGEVRLRRAIRAHGNAVEHVLLFALPLLALALLGAASTVLAVLVTGFALARVLHAAGMLQPQFRLRQVGAGLTYLLELAAVVALLLVLT